MVADKFIKEFILKFKSEGSDQIKKVAESMSKTFNPRETDRFIKSLENVQRQFGKSGSGISSEFKKVTDYFKELNNQHFVKAERNLDRMGRLLKAQVENIERLKAAGASAEEIAQRESTLRNTSERFEGMVGNVPYRRPAGVRGLISQAGGGSMTAGSLTIAAAAAQIALQVSRYQNQFQAGVAQNRIAIAGQLKSQTAEYYAGDMSRAVVLSRPGAAGRILDRASGLQASNERSQWISLGANMLGGAAAVGGAGLTGGFMLGGPAGAALGAIGGAAVGGAMGFARGGMNLASYYFGGDKEAYATRSLELARQEEGAKTYDPELYRKFEQSRAMRYQYQRQLSLGDDAALAARSRFRAAGVLDEGEMASTMLSFRRFGTARGVEAAASAAEIARTTGMSVGTSAQLMQQFAATSRGGLGTAAKDMQEVMTTAVKVGISDSGLIEEYQKGAAAIAGSIGALAAPADVASMLNRFGVTSDMGTERGIQAMMQGAQSFGRVLGGTSELTQTTKHAELLGLAKGDLLKYRRLRELGDSELASLADTPELLKSLGITKEEALGFQKRQIERTQRSGMGSDRMAALKQKMQSGTIEMNELRDYLAGSGVAGTNRMTDETVRSLARGIGETAGDVKKGQTRFKDAAGNLIDPFATDPGAQTKAMSNIFAGMGTAASRATVAAGEAATKEDVQIREKIEKPIDNIIEVFKTQGEKLNEAVTNNGLDKSITDVSDALQELVEAIKTSSAQIAKARSQ